MKQNKTIIILIIILVMILSSCTPPQIIGNKTEAAVCDSLRLTGKQYYCSYADEFKKAEGSDADADLPKRQDFNTPQVAPPGMNLITDLGNAKYFVSAISAGNISTPPSEDITCTVKKVDNCLAEEACLFSMAGRDKDGKWVGENAHISPCQGVRAYPYKLCCGGPVQFTAEYVIHDNAIFSNIYNKESIVAITKVVTAGADYNTHYFMKANRLRASSFVILSSFNGIECEDPKPQCSTGFDPIFVVHKSIGLLNEFDNSHVYPPESNPQDPFAVVCCKDK